MNYYREKKLKEFEETHNRKLDCSINAASNEIMLDRISGGEDIEFPFSSLIKE